MCRVGEEKWLKALADFPGLLEDIHPVIRDDCEAGAIVSAILKLLEARENNWLRLAMPDVSVNSTHYGFSSGGESAICLTVTLTLAFNSDSTIASLTP